MYDALRHSQGPTFRSRMKCGAPPPPMVLPSTLTAVIPALFLSGVVFGVFFQPLLRRRQGALLQTAPHDPAGAGGKKKSFCTTCTEQSYVRVKGKDEVGRGRGVNVTSATSNCHIAVRPPPTQPHKAAGKVSRQLGSVDIVAPPPSNTRVMLSWILRQLQFIVQYVWFFCDAAVPSVVEPL